MSSITCIRVFHVTMRRLIANDLEPATIGIFGILQAVREDRKVRKQLGDCALNAN